MGEVVRLKRPRKETIRSVARELLSDALKANKDPRAVVIVVLAKDGYAKRAANLRDTISDFDMYARAGAIIDKSKLDLVD